MKQIPSEIDKILKKAYFTYLCSVDEQNQSHITPMFFFFDKQTQSIFVITSLNSKKASNIQRNPQVSLTMDIRDSENPFNNEGIMVQGMAKIEGPKYFNLTIQDLRRVYQGFERKYPAFQAREVAELHDIKEDYPSQVLIKITPRKIVYWKSMKFISIKF